MKPCPEERYWDPLLNGCVSCRPICSRQVPRTCTAFCKSLSCHKEQGWYYDQLLRGCISCAPICGHHPAPCAHFCESLRRGRAALRPAPRRPRPGQAETGADAAGRSPGSEHGGLEAGPAPPGLRLSADQRALVYSALGLCLGAILCGFLLAMVCFLKRRGDQASRQCPPGLCPTPAASSQDPRMEAGPQELELELEQEQERVEACSFCFPQCRAPAQERGGAPGPPGPMRAGRCRRLGPTMAEQPCAGSPDSSLQAVCSPTQEGGLAV
ncbi:tumor necrosis factor receptor superfamily member 13B [Myotis myotis]|uniref:TNF receptor superfamily member 13B n=1 Tax=Myotis myotis TaxID=51298 RepID=A0A7J7RDP1_MYOMY|nr:tumor necrosis factor receptor superfamily member 13B [Myotis myotis]KAF6274300.1 TNF receptor superfamily member 13B [Myotis myotis]